MLKSPSNPVKPGTIA